MRDRAESECAIVERERFKEISKAIAVRDEAIAARDEMAAKLRRELEHARAHCYSDRATLQIFGYKYDKIVEILTGHSLMKARLGGAIAAARQLRLWVKGIRNALTGEPIARDILKETAWIDEAQP